jgi:hypothetical protein
LGIVFALLVLYIGAGVLSGIPVTTYKNDRKPDAYLLELSEGFLAGVKKGDTQQEQAALAGLTTKGLLEGLGNDAAKKVFWMNVYNGWYQLEALRNRPDPENIYTEKLIHFSDISLSLDDIEHGILRRYRWKYSLGYLPQFFPDSFIKQMAVKSLDYRIHFALNCGAKSCPPIVLYNFENLDTQLEQATHRFILGETEIDDKQRRVYTSKILSWYRGDFKSAGGINAFLGNTLNKDLTGYKVVFNEYDWTELLNNYNNN